MSDLKKLEATIRKGQTAFFAAAKALLEIERRGLWSPTFTSIVEYAAARFGLGGCDVSRYRNAAIVLEKGIQQAAFRRQLLHNQTNGHCRIWFTGLRLEVSSKATRR